MKHSKTTVALGALLFAAGGCEDQTPTSLDPDRIPVEARTVEVRLPFSDFAGNVRFFGGFGSASDGDRGYIARDFGTLLNAHTLVRFGSFPTEITVRDTLGVSRTDTNLTFPSGRVVVFFDSASVRGEPPFDVSAAALQTPWNLRSASWEFAVDTLGNQEAWPTPGGGPVRAVAAEQWSPEDGDSLVIPIDSITLAEWRDDDNAARGLRLSMETLDARVRVRSANLRVDVRASVRPDSLLTPSPILSALTFIYDPLPDPGQGEFRIGGVPSWRTVFDLDIPEVLDGPPEVCALIGCPFELTAESVIFASLVLTGAPSPLAFRPVESLFLDIRPAMSPERLPRSPLGPSLLQTPRELLPAYFTEDDSTSISVPMTPFIQAVIRGPGSDGTPPPNTLTLMSAFESSDLDIATFAPPGSEDEPYLRIIFTLTDGVTLP